MELGANEVDTLGDAILHSPVGVTARQFVEHFEVRLTHVEIDGRIDERTRIFLVFLLHRGEGRNLVVHLASVLAGGLGVLHQTNNQRLAEQVFQGLGFVAHDTLFEVRSNLQGIHSLHELVDVRVVTHEAVGVVGELEVEPARLVFDVLGHHDACVFIRVLDHDDFAFAIDLFHVLFQQLESHQHLEHRLRVFHRARLFAEVNDTNYAGGIATCFQQRCCGRSLVGSLSWGVKQCHN